MMQTTKSFLRQACWVGFLGLAIVSFPASGLTLTVEEVSNPRQENGGWVTDMADLLSPATEAAINCQISALEAKNGSEIAVVTVPETAPAVTPKEFAITIFNHWGMGKQGQDNGVLVLVSKADRRVEIAIGYGLAGILPDAKVGNIIYQTMIPHFKRADYDGGTLAGTTLLVQALEAEPASVEVSPTIDQLDFGLIALRILYGLYVVGWLAVIAYPRRRASGHPLWIRPTGFWEIATSDSKHELKRSAYCCDCKQPMKKLKLGKLRDYLNKPQQVAQRLGSVSFVGWHCPQCHPELDGPGSIHVRAYAQNDDQFRSCPTCKELTVVRKKKILKQATQHHSGKRQILDTCHCCSYSQKREEIIPQIPSPPLPLSI